MDSDKKPPGHLFSDLKRRMRRRKEAGESAAAPPPKALPEPPSPTPAVPPAEAVAPLRGPAAERGEGRHRRKTLAAAFLALYKRLGRLFSRDAQAGFRDLLKTQNAGPMPAWTRKSAGAAALEASVGRGILARLRQYPTAASGILMTAGFAAVLGLARVAERVEERGAVSFDLRRALSREPARPALSGLPLIACRPDLPGCPKEEKPARGAPTPRLGAGGLRLPGSARASILDVLDPKRIQERRRESYAVAGIGAYLVSKPEEDLERTLISRKPAGGAPSPFGPAYDGRKVDAGRPKPGKRGLTTRGPEGLPTAEGYAAPGPGNYQQVPKGKRGEELVQEMIDDSGDIETALKEYAKSGKWAKLQKVSNDFQPTMPGLDGRALANSEAAYQLLETKRATDRSMHCGECRPEDRVHDNRATYFGEPY